MLLHTSSFHLSLPPLCGSSRMKICINTLISDRSRQDEWMNTSEWVNEWMNEWMNGNDDFHFHEVIDSINGNYTHLKFQGKKDLSTS